MRMAVGGHHHRGVEEDDPVRSRGGQIFLGQQLDGVGDGLDQSPGAGPVGAQAELQKPQEAALDIDQVGGEQQQNHQHYQQFHDQEGDTGHPEAHGVILAPVRCG